MTAQRQFQTAADFDSPREALERIGMLLAANCGEITNAAESIIEELVRHYGVRSERDGQLVRTLQHRVIYRDTLGVWDELAHDGARFRGYKPIGASSVRQAIERLKGETC